MNSRKHIYYISVSDVQRLAKENMMTLKKYGLSQKL